MSPSMIQQFVDDIREPLFDTYTAAESAVLPTRILMFTEAQSATKGPELTNMKKDGELPNPENHMIYGVRVIFGADMLEADVIAMTQKYCLRLVVSGFAKLTCPLEYVPGNSEGGAVVFTLPEDLKIEIKAGAQFYVELVSRTGATMAATGGGGKGLHVRVLLDGVHTVPVGV